MGLQEKAKIFVYKYNDQEVSIKADLKFETLWASQEDIKKVFCIDQSVVSRHIRNIFKDNELDIKSNMQKMHIANSDKLVTFYSLDVILAVGYRANTKRAIGFRQWANEILKQYILEGYVVNKRLISENYQLFNNVIEDIKALAPMDAVGIIEIIRVFAYAWLSLGAYDSSVLPKKGFNKLKLDITGEELVAGVYMLKRELLEKGLASKLFALEVHSGSLLGILKRVYQSFDGIEVYNSIEEKAANLLYLIVKNHPFVDGNKRVGAFAFLWYLEKARMLNILKISPEVLITLTILIAQSKSMEKDRMIGLILQLLRYS